MSSPNDLRSSERIPISTRVKMVSKGKVIAYAIGLNISMGGVLVHATQTLPVGSTCQLAIYQSGAEAGRRVMAEGTVIRAGEGQMAIRFAQPLAQESYQAFAQSTAAPARPSILQAYRNYFRVSFDQNLAECENLLGVSKKTFRTVFYTTFSTCIPMAILPVWLLRASIPAAPNLLKIALCFAYAAVWLMILQPAMDMTVFHFLRKREATAPKA
ncbi:MAG TPA: PilZ domain-containing protein [Holophagaceae bacterium]|nr:PilZ domain-containing protein [Holophagaceae bacterium]